MMKKLLILLFIFFSCNVMAQENKSAAAPEQMDVQTIDALDSVIFDCSQLTGVSGPIQIPVSI
jgi:hypothetical protein